MSVHELDALIIFLAAPHPAQLMEAACGRLLRLFAAAAVAQLNFLVPAFRPAPLLPATLHTGAKDRLQTLFPLLPWLAHEEKKLMVERPFPFLNGL